MENLNTNNANNETGDKTVALRISSPVISAFRERKILRADIEHFKDDI